MLPIQTDRLQYHLNRTKYPGDLTDTLVNGVSHGFSLGHFSNPVNNGYTATKLSPRLEMVIKEKIEFEIKAGRVKGPFKNIPFPDFQISPISVREKSTPGTYRLIHNLSFPHNGSSINENIDACYKSVQYSNINSAITSMLNLPIGAYSAKSDIQDAFRLIPIKESDHPKLGMYFNGEFYYDTTLPMGVLPAVNYLKHLVMHYTTL